MEPKPVITYFGDSEVISSVQQKKLQARLKQLQVSTLPKYVQVSLLNLVDLAILEKCTPLISLDGAETATNLIKSLMGI